MFKDFILIVLLIFALLIPSMGWASVAGEVNKANDLYKQGKIDDSLSLYQKAFAQDEQSSVVKYDLGTALYKKGDYAKAMGYLEQAAQDKNIKIKPRAEYNLGNVLYKSGIQNEKTNVDQAIKSLQDATEHYGQSLGLDPKDKDALYNQDFVKKEIERLKQKKQEQQQKQQQQQNQKDQKQDKQNQQKQQKEQGQEGQQKQANQQQQQKQQEQQAKEAQEGKPQDRKKQNQQSAQAQSVENQKQVDRKQAEDLLEDYQENEEPKKLLNYMPKKIDNRPVLKDW